MKKNILLVDDEQNMRVSGSIALKMAGFKTETAKDGQEAFDKVMETVRAGRLFDLIVTDIMMPNTDGIELIDMLNLNKVCIPIMVITGDDRKNTVVKLLRRGCVDYISKPFQPEELVESINNLLNGRLLQVKERAQNQAQPYHDPITGLPGRQLFYTRLSSAVREAQKCKKMLSVLFLGLDRFNKINSNFGFEVGYKVLHEVAERMKSCIRNGDTLAQLYSYEFAVLLPQIEDHGSAVMVTRRILEAFEQPIFSRDYEVFITLSVGICIFPGDGENPEALLKNANFAMDKAKKQGGNNFQFYKNDMNSHSFEKLKLENKLRKALKQNEFVLHYQPTVDLRTGEISGMEALLRWNCPELGLVAPGEFIPIAEETGLIVPIGSWVLRTACEQSRAFQKAGFPPIRLSVNLSARQFQRENLLETVRGVLKDTGLAPDLLDLELTESTVMDNAESAINTLTKFKSMGINLSIDDFGTGYSSLSYLKRLPFDTLKIDRSFVCDVTTNQFDTKIIKAIIAMAHSLDFKVVAEGVEKQEQAIILRKFGCDTIQGYFFSRPVPGEEFVKLLQNNYRLNIKSLDLEQNQNKRKGD